MSLDYTTFYYPGKGGHLRMLNYRIWISDPNTPKEMKDDSIMVDEPSETFIWVNPGDLPYEYFIEFEEEIMNLEPTTELLNHYKLSLIEENISKMKSPMFYVRREPEPTEVKTEIIFRWCYKNTPIDAVAREFGFDSLRVKNIIYEFQALKRITKKISKSANQKSEKLNQSHHECLSALVRTRGIKGFTRDEARSHLLNEFPSLNNIDISTIGRQFHQNLGLSFKKLGGTNVKKMNSQSKINLQMWTKLIINLLLQQYYLIFIDEFKINRSTQKTYGWTKRGKPGRLLIRSPDFNMSFVVAHSQTWLEGIMGQRWRSTKQSIRYFLKSWSVSSGQTRTWTGVN